MPTRKARAPRRSLRLLAALLLVCTAVACGSSSTANGPLVVWTVLTGEEDMRAQRQIVAAYERENPGVEVQLTPKPETGDTTGDATTLISAVRGGSPPDVSVLGRFAVSQYAAIGLVSDLQPMVDETSPRITDNYVPFSLEEGMYEDHLYALPFDFDVRGLFYNKDVLKQSGVDPAVLDPKNGPPTLAEVRRIADKVTRADSKGNYTRLGFIPWDGQGNHATWGLGHGARYLDTDSCRVTPDEPAFRDAFQYLRRESKRLDYDRVNAFLATYQPSGAPPNQTPFFTGRLGMAIDGNWLLTSIEKYAPKLNYGLTYLPVEKEGDAPFTWSGGFGLVIPKGAPDADRSWKFMRYMAGPKGQAIYAKTMNKLPTWEPLLSDPAVVGNQGTFATMVDGTVSRPSIPVGAAFSSAMDSAQEAVLSGVDTPDSALRKVRERVEPQMKQYCPYQLPKVHRSAP